MLKDLFITLLCMSIFFNLILTSHILHHGSTNTAALITACEAELPRNVTCKLIAVEDTE